MFECPVQTGGSKDFKDFGSHSQHLPTHASKVQDGCWEKQSQTENEHLPQWKFPPPSHPSKIKTCSQVCNYLLSIKYFVIDLVKKRIKPTFWFPSGLLQTGFFGVTSWRTSWILFVPFRCWLTLWLLCLENIAARKKVINLCAAKVFSCCSELCILVNILYRVYIFNDCFIEMLWMTVLLAHIWVCAIRWQKLALRFCKYKYSLELFFLKRSNWILKRTTAFTYVLMPFLTEITELVREWASVY